MASNAAISSDLPSESIEKCELRCVDLLGVADPLRALDGPELDLDVPRGLHGLERGDFLGFGLGNVSRVASIFGPCLVVRSRAELATSLTAWPARLAFFVRPALARELRCSSAPAPFDRGFSVSWPRGLVS